MKFSDSIEFSAPNSEVLAVQFAMPIQQELGMALAMALTLVGMVLHWQLPHRRISMEERIKDGKLTEAQARTRLRIFNWCAPVATFLGIALLLGVLLAFAE